MEVDHFFPEQPAGVVQGDGVASGQVEGAGSIAGEGKHKSLSHVLVPAVVDPVALFESDEKRRCVLSAHRVLDARAEESGRSEADDDDFRVLPLQVIQKGFDFPLGARIIPVRVGSQRGFLCQDVGVVRVSPVGGDGARNDDFGNTGCDRSLQRLFASLDVDFIDSFYGHSLRRLDYKGEVIQNIHALEQGLIIRGSHVRSLKTAFGRIKRGGGDIQAENRVNPLVLVQQREDELTQVSGDAGESDFHDQSPWSTGLQEACLCIFVSSSILSSSVMRMRMTATPLLLGDVTTRALPGFL